MLIHYPDLSHLTIGLTFLKRYNCTLSTIMHDSAVSTFTLLADISSSPDYMLINVAYSTCR